MRSAAAPMLLKVAAIDSAMSTGWQFTANAPICKSTGVEQIADQAVQPVSFLVDGLSASRTCSGRHVTSDSSSPETIALIEASGVRKS